MSRRLNETNSSWTNTNLTNQSSGASDKFVIGPTSILGQVILPIIATIFIFLCGTSAVMLHRTKRTPYAARFLGTGLLTFDTLFLTVITFRKFVTNAVIYTTLYHVATMWSMLVFVTIWSCILERCLLFAKPMLYLRVFTADNIRRVAVSIWLATATLYMFIRYGVCYTIHQSIDVFITPGTCRQIVLTSILVFTVLVTISTAFAYRIIISTILEKSTSGQQGFAKSSTASKLSEYKSTALIFAHATVSIFAICVVCVIVALRNYGVIDKQDFQLTSEFIQQANSFVDPILYAMWYRECRHQYVKVLAMCSTRMKKLSIKMHYEINNIVLTSAISGEKGNFTEPIGVDTSQHNDQQHTQQGQVK